ncbi:hypothetical protein H0H81_005205, partial [Sphagnurus paluster]
MKQGEHDINKELVFGSYPGFIFHDSCGFKPGAVVELDSVKKFISKHSKEEGIDEQLHAI